MDFKANGKELAKTNVLLSSKKEMKKEVKWNEVLEFDVQPDGSIEVGLYPNFGTRHTHSFAVVNSSEGETEASFALPSLKLFRGEEKPLTIPFEDVKLELVFTAIDFGKETAGAFHCTLFFLTQRSAQSSTNKTTPSCSKIQAPTNARRGRSFETF